MKQLFTGIVILSTAFAGLSQSSRCCPTVQRDTFNLAQIQAMSSTPVVIISPPPGMGVRFVRPAILRNHCAASGMGFASGEFINIFNEANVLNIMQQFSDPSVTTQGIYSAYFFQNYEVVRNGQPLFPGSGSTCTGEVKVNATFPVTGFTGDYWVLETVYEYFAF